MVLFVFVIMLVNLDVAIRQIQFNRMWLVALLLAVALGAQVYMVFHYAHVGMTEPLFQLTAAPAANLEPNTELVGATLFEQYMLPFEIASILLLVSMIGAVVMAKTQGINDALDFTLSGVESGAVHDWRHRRGHAPQRHHYPDEHRADPERGEYQSGGVLAARWRSVEGQVFAIFIITDAAAEAAVGLGIMIAFFRNRETVLEDEMDLLKWCRGGSATEMTIRIFSRPHLADTAVSRWRARCSCCCSGRRITNGIVSALCVGSVVVSFIFAVGAVWQLIALPAENDLSRSYFLTGCPPGGCTRRGAIDAI